MSNSISYFYTSNDRRALDITNRTTRDVKHVEYKIDAIISSSENITQPTSMFQQNPINPHLPTESILSDAGPSDALNPSKFIN